MEIPFSKGQTDAVWSMLTFVNPFDRWIQCRDVILKMSNTFSQLSLVYSSIRTKNSCKNFRTQNFLEVNAIIIFTCSVYTCEKKIVLQLTLCKRRRFVNSENGQRRLFFVYNIWCHCNSSILGSYSKVKRESKIFGKSFLRARKQTERFHTGVSYDDILNR